MTKKRQARLSGFDILWPIVCRAARGTGQGCMVVWYMYIIWKLVESQEGNSLTAKSKSHLFSNRRPQHQRSSGRSVAASVAAWYTLLSQQQNPTVHYCDVPPSQTFHGARSPFKKGRREREGGGSETCPIPSRYPRLPLLSTYTIPCSCRSVWWCGLPQGK